MKLKKIISPNSTQCEGCPSWDDVNGCWADVDDVDSCDKLNEDGYYPFTDEDEEDEED